MSETALPDGWETKRLGDLCDGGRDGVVDGPFGSNLKRSDFVESGVPVLKLQNVKANRIVQKNMDYITEAKYHELSRHSFVSGDIVMTKLGDPLGVSAIVAEIDRGVIVADLVRIRPGGINSRFLCHQLNSPLVSRHLNENQKGTTRPRINLSIARNLFLLVPPLDEQERIVEILEEQLSRLDAAVKSVQTVREKAAQFRRSLLHAAFTGSLTQSTARQVLRDWDVSELGKVARWGSGGTPKSGQSKFYDGGIPWCVIGDLNEATVVDTERTISQEGLANSSAKLVAAGTVLLAMYGASIGRTGVAGVEMATNQAIAFAIPHKEDMSPSFLLKYLQSQKEAFVRAGQGGAQPNISQTIIKSWPVPIPPLSEQDLIVEILEEQLSRLDATLAVADEVERKANALRRSLLHAAFTGELTRSWREANV